MTKRLLSALIATAALANLGVAQAQTKAGSCLPREQGEAVMVAVIPALVQSAQLKCARALPRSASLYSDTQRLDAVFRPAADAAWPVAKKAIPQLSGVTLPRGLDDSIVRPLFEATITGQIASQIEPEDCPALDQFYAALLPLPPASFGKLLLAFSDLIQRRDSKLPMRICNPSAIR